MIVYIYAGLQTWRRVMAVDRYNSEKLDAPAVALVEDLVFEQGIREGNRAATLGFVLFMFFWPVIAIGASLVQLVAWLRERQRQRQQTAS